MFPALEMQLKQETHRLPDPYEDFMYHHLQYYGYFKAQRGSLPNSATYQHIQKNNHRYLLNGSLGEKDDLLPDTLQKDTHTDYYSHRSFSFCRVSEKAITIR
ncbi:cytosolic carboxypeptidase 2-like [Cebus imitator]|uniref:cytosolic carboxypeptidase 2-like n=1 Tax=Cebus imitator TaxID=2715852 RepID=UPI00080A20CF|nr:cytosolic carboxypeptidase 2-like [Cebus imitator]